MNKSKPGSKGVGSNRRAHKANRKLGHTSKKFCQEKLACHGQPLANYQCKECRTLQCEACENLLHENAKFLFHDRVVLTPVSPSLLCQENCQEKNFADVHCEGCNKNICFECEELTHTTARKLHQRVPFELPTPDTFQGTSDFDEFYSASWPYEDEEEFSEVNLPSSSSAVIETEDTSADLRLHQNLNCLSEALKSIEIGRMKSKKNGQKVAENDETYSKSFVLIDDKENLQVSFLVVLKFVTFSQNLFPT